MRKNLGISLILLYMIPWGIQCIIGNFMPIYVASLPFATEKTVGEVTALGSVVIMLSQLVWTKIADRSKNKNNVLALSLVLLAAFAGLFLIKGITKPLLFIFVILFFSCYMTHSSLIDIVVAENCHKTKHSFGWFRSFASFGYAFVGLLITFLPNDNPKYFFIYCIILSLLSAVISKGIPSQKIQTVTKKSNEKIYNKDLISFLILTFLLYFCSSILVSFFPVYYTKDIGGSVGILSLMISIATFWEWGIMMFFAKPLEKMSPRLKFFIMAISGVFKTGAVFVFENEYLILISYLFQGIWYGILWSSVTPYIKSIVPEKGFASAQGLWIVVASGLATFVGSYTGGVIGEAIGLKMLFGIVTVLLIIISGLSLLLVKKE